MANNQNHQLNTEQIRELLSPYLDGEVTDVERVQVELALAGSPELQRELEMLRRTIALVAALPAVAASRPFTLTEAQVKPVKPARAGFMGLPGWFKGMAALTATLLCVVVAGGLFWSMQFSGGSQPAAEIASAPTMAAEAPAAAPAQEEANQADSAAREGPAPAIKATEEDRGEAAEAAVTLPPTPTIAPTAETMMAAPAEPPVAAQEVAPADESTALESQTITEAYEAAPAEQPAADAAPATEAPPPSAALTLPELTATPSPVPSVAVLAAPAQELPQEKAAANDEAEAGQLAAESAPAPAVAPVEENAAESAEAQTDQLTVESAPVATPELLEQKQTAPTATPLPPPSATPAAMLTLPVPETPPATFTPAPPVEKSSGNWGLPLVGAVAALLIIVGLIIWLISRASKQTPS